MIYYALTFVGGFVLAFIIWYEPPRRSVLELWDEPERSQEEDTNGKT